VQPEGPYQLGGFCFGGVVAYEIARQLTGAGEKVSLLAALESAPPNVGARRDAAYSIENVYENFRDFMAQPATGKVDFVRSKARKIRERLSRRARHEEEKPPQLSELIDMSKYPKDYVRFAETHWKALESYRPGPYNGTIYLFRARKQPLRSFDPSLGWQTLAPGHVKISVIPGTHETMVHDPNVQVLVDKLKEVILETNS
jgi:thioesterase domain-containing protein